LGGTEKGLTGEQEQELDRAWQSSQAVEVRPAMSLAELQDAYELVYRKYLEKGYLAPDEAGVRLSKYNLLPESMTIVGVFQRGVVATVTLVPDSPLGLPMDLAYVEEADALRGAGRRLAEVSMLADRRRFGQRSIARTLPMLLRLMKMLFDYTRDVVNCTDLCIAVHPDHERFYTRYLLFERMGEVKEYPSVERNPAVACRLNLDHIEERCRGNRVLMKNFFSRFTSPETFSKRYTFTCEDVRLLFAERVQVVQALDSGDLAYLSERYPDCDLQSMAQLPV